MNNKFDLGNKIHEQSLHRILHLNILFAVSVYLGHEEQDEV